MEKITFCEQGYTLPHCMILQGIGLVLHDTELILNGPDSGLLSDIDTIEVYLSEWRDTGALNEEKKWLPHDLYWHNPTERATGEA